MSQNQAVEADSPNRLDWNKLIDGGVQFKSLVRPAPGDLASPERKVLGKPLVSRQFRPGDARSPGAEKNHYVLYDALKKHSRWIRVISTPRASSQLVTSSIMASKPHK